MASKINVAIIGIGDVCSALVQGIENYKKNPENIIGILPFIKQYNISDINFVLGIEVNSNKVGKDMSEAIFAEPNCNKKLFTPDFLDAPVIKGPILDGLDSNIKDIVPVSSEQEEANIAFSPILTWPTACLVIYWTIPDNDLSELEEEG